MKQKQLQQFTVESLQNAHTFQLSQSMKEEKHHFFVIDTAT